MLIEAVSSFPVDDDSGASGADRGIQINLDNVVESADFSEAKNWGTLTIDASCTPADITYLIDLKLLTEESC